MKILMFLCELYFFIYIHVGGKKVRVGAGVGGRVEMELRVDTPIIMEDLCGSYVWFVSRFLHETYIHLFFS